jgi:hypothetical protein
VGVNRSPALARIKSITAGQTCWGRPQAPNLHHQDTQKRFTTETQRHRDTETQRHKEDWTLVFFEAQRVSRFTFQVSGIRNVGGPESVGINRHETADERAVRGRDSDPPRPRVMRRDLVRGWRSVDRGAQAGLLSFRIPDAASVVPKGWRNRLRRKRRADRPAKVSP